MRKKNHHKSGQNNVPSATSSGSSQERQRGNAGIEQNAEQDAAVFRPKRSTRTINVPGQLFAVAFLEIFLVFAVFFVYGAWPVPDTNEPYYVGKAIHFWHPDTFKNDVFLNSHNTHWLFYQSFGWLSLFLAPDTMVWAGRIFLWLALAWGWYRLSRVLVAVPLFSVFSALMFACFMLRFQMAGEWVIGGIEGKVFAYVFVLFGLDALARNRWKRMWLFFGLAAGYHVLVGGWSAVAGAIAWLLQRKTDRTPLKHMLLPMLLGAILSLPGVIPAVWIDWGCDPAISGQAYQINVFERLPHHLVPYTFPWSFVARLGLLTMVWFFCVPIVWGRKPLDREAVDKYEYYLENNNNPDNDPEAVVEPPEPTAPPGYRIATYVIGTILISCIGFVIAYGFRGNERLSAWLLRFYWFRMTDFAVPMGMALCGIALLQWEIQRCFGHRFPKKTSWWAKNLVRISLILLVIYATAYALAAAYASYARRNYGDFHVAAVTDLALLSVLLAGSVFLFVSRRHHFGTDSEKEPSSFRPLFAICIVLLLVFGSTTSDFLFQLETRLEPAIPRTSPPYTRFYEAWRDVCHWISDPQNTPEDAVFLVPRGCESFKWYAKRANVSTWKEMPQDSESLVLWFQTMNDCYSVKHSENPPPNSGLAMQIQSNTPEELAELQKKYGFSFILAESEPRLALPVVYETKYYILYRADESVFNFHSESETIDVSPQVIQVQRF